MTSPLLPAARFQLSCLVLLVLLQSCVWQFAYGADKCGALFTPEYESGVIHSPNYPSFYPHDRVCIWKIDAGADHLVEISFHTPFHVEDSNVCQYDKIEIYDVFANNTKIEKRVLCGKHAPPTYTSETSKVEIDFFSDNTNYFRGFSATWRKVEKPCYFKLTGKNGVITPPNTNSTTVNHDCSWEIIAPDGEYVVVHVDTSFDDSDKTNSCIDGVTDTVQVSDLTDEGRLRQYDYCGMQPNTNQQTQLPSPWVSMGQRALVTFLSKSGHGDFQIHWRTGNNYCGNWLINAPTGRIHSYFYGGNEEMHSSKVPSCTQVVTADPLYKIELTIHEANCSETQLFNVYNNIQQPIVIPKSLCDAQSNSSVKLTSQSNQVRILTSDNRNNEKHLSLDWKFVCQHTFDDANGTLTSPNYPNPYPHNEECEWHIRSKPNHAIKLRFDSTFDLEEDNQGCRFDYVEVFDVLGDGTLFSRGKFCGSNSPGTLVSGFTEVIVKFHTNTVRAGKGFSLSWDTGSSCGGSISGNKGKINFPFVPDGYLPGTVCQWEVTGMQSPNNKTVLTLDTIDINKQDELQIAYDNGNGGNTYSSFNSGNRAGTRIIVDTDSMKIKFTAKTLGRLNQGFSLHWDYPKSFTEDSVRGIITSPNYGKSYPNSFDYNWLIRAPKPDHVIKLTFVGDFDLEQANDGTCPYDYVEVFDGTSSSSSMGRFCGNTVPGPFTSSTRDMKLSFHSDNDKSGSGFKVFYNTACGALFLDSHGNFSSPYDPKTKSYPPNLDCRWEIDAGQGRTVRLTFGKNFALESNKKCDADYLEIYDAYPNGKEELRGKWCGYSAPTALTSESSKFIIKFHSDNVKGDSGFFAEWDSLCGDLLHSTQGHLSSPAFPVAYPNNLDCRWEINTNPGQRVKLEFGSTFDLEMDNHNCAYDHVEVLDYFANGTTVSYGRWCSVDSAPEIVSLGSKLEVRFHSDADKNGMGFEANWTTVSQCGSTINTDTGFIMSPQFPHNYPENADCHWRISPPGGQNITLTFDSKFGTELSNKCQWDFVEVTRGSAVVGRWCGNIDVPSQIVSNGQPIDIKFQSDKSNTATGFFVSWVPS